jgi:predicted RNA polymerase sigma factor
LPGPPWILSANKRRNVNEVDNYSVESRTQIDNGPVLEAFPTTSAGLEKGLALMDQLGASGELENYHLYHAARADILRRLDRREEAIDAYRRAVDLVANRVEEAYLRRRIAELEEATP